MDKRPIGVFDSGLGGLTTVKKLSELMPGEDIIYLGDTGRVPYGSRSKETIVKYSCQAASFLAGHGIKAMVIACNTASSSAYDVLAGSYAMPVYEAVSTPAKAAASQTGCGRIGVIGTKATIGSGAYESALMRISPDFTVFSAPCPLFVPLVEDGAIEEDDVAALAIAERYLRNLRSAGIDTLILGCTHYPLLRGVISKVMGPQVALIDSGAETAKLVAGDLSAKDMLSGRDEGGSTRYYVTDATDGFEELASRFLESDIRGMVQQIALE
ncbi:MAG: glutamate racemase [Oscillospiraceae bacterium]|nr:glutamate racemase [Oscillospiraceae bacterium]